MVSKYKLSFAAANFSRNLIQGEDFDKVYSLMPLIVSGELPEIKDDGYDIVYSNWRKKRSILAKFAIFYEQWTLFKKVKKDDVLWLYNLNIINALLFILIKVFKPSVKLNIIVLDLPMVNIQSLRKCSALAWETVHKSTFRPTNRLQKTLLAVGGATIALRNPLRADMVNALCETTGLASVRALYNQMNQNSTGRQILAEKPRITSSSLQNAEALNSP